MTEAVFKKFLPCTFTERAIQEIEHTLSTKNIPSQYGLRVGIKGGGCSGISFMLGFDTEKESDDIFLLGKIKVLIEKKHAMYLAGVQIDFEDGVNARGFIFNDGRSA